MSTYDDASLIMYPSGYKADKIYSLKPTDGSGDFDFTRASTATRVNESGLIETVATGVPRIDYTGGGCGKLLLEPQRSNLITYSNDFSNASWTKVNSTITANDTTSPDGTQNASRLVISASGYLLFQYTANVSAGGSWALSIFAKNQNTNFLRLGGATPSGTDTYLIQDMGNGWYRHFLTRTFASANASFNLQYLIGEVGTHYIYGAQLEEGSYPTSYIPTAGATATRLSDNPTLAGMQANGIFGATQGTVILEFSWKETDYIFDFNDTSGTRLRIFNNGGTDFWIRDLIGASWYVTGFTHTFGENTKIGIRWDGTTVTAFQNGVKAASDKTFSAPMAIDSFSGVKTSDNQSFIFFPTALSDTECITLTTL